MLTALVLTLALQAPPEPHWSLRPLQAPPVPASSAWARNEIDAFVQQRLAAAGLAPSPPATRRELIRRATYDLTGLPPTPAEVDAFLADPDPDAFARVVDRLLASPRHAERYARHWLDLVHFGETHGFDKDKPRPNAWRYRDWVIGALQADLPWARFVTAQLAGDVLFARGEAGADALVATGMLAAGPWDYVGHVELREGTVAKDVTRLLDRDDMVMTVMSTFASVTAHCARCHDHKFDPIPQADYYALQAVFAGVERAEVEYDPDPQVAAVRRALAAERADLAQAALASRRLPLGWHSELSPSAEVERSVTVDLGVAHAIDTIALVPAHEAYGKWPGPGFGFPVRYRVEVAEDAGFASPVVVADCTGADVPNPGDVPVVIDTAGRAARYVRLVATRLWRRTGDHAFALGELMVLAGGRNVARGANVDASDSIELGGLWSKAFLVDGMTCFGPAIDATWLAATVEAAAADRLARADLDRRVAELPAPARTYCATARFRPDGAFTPPAAPRPVHVLRRGDVQSPMAEAAPGALACVAALPSRFDLAAGAPEGERRLALARWLTASEQPLAWRSIVNRVWQWHFGRGLVDTPNDFGRMGSAPSHPELLDWLAVRFRDDGGSLRRLHRLILSSAAWQQSSADRADARAVDADNGLLWRMHRHRLDAEQVRDALLAIAGRLELSMGGPSEQHFVFHDDHSPVYDYAAFAPQIDGARRRSIYRFVVRSVPDPFLDTADCPDPSVLTPKRNVTITALQALAMQNDAFVLAQCRHLADRMQRERPDDVAAQVALAVELALGRPAAPDEVAAFAAHAREFGLVAACRVIVNLSEFLFVD